MVVTLGKNYFLDFNSEWFSEEYDKNNSLYEYPDEPYTQLVDDFYRRLGIRGDFNSVRVKVRYISGNEFVIDGIKEKSEDILFYDLDNNVWKHRHVIMVRPLTEKGVQEVVDFLKALPHHPAFMEIDNEVTLIGEIQEDVKDCIPCRKGK